MEYFYRFQVVEVDDSVRQVVETHMRAHLRREDRTDDNDVHEGAITQLYMPSWHMETLLASLLAALSKADGNVSQDPAFTLFILNPSRKWGLSLPGVDYKRATYGYRCGLSTSSIKASHETSRYQQRWGVI